VPFTLDANSLDARLVLSNNVANEVAKVDILEMKPAMAAVSNARNRLRTGSRPRSARAPRIHGTYG